MCARKTRACAHTSGTKERGERERLREDNNREQEETQAWWKKQCESIESPGTITSINTHASARRLECIIARMRRELCISAQRWGIIHALARRRDYEDTDNSPGPKEARRASCRLFRDILYTRNVVLRKRLSMVI